MNEFEQWVKKTIPLTGGENEIAKCAWKAAIDYQEKRIVKLHLMLEGALANFDQLEAILHEQNYEEALKLCAFNHQALWNFLYEQGRANIEVL